MSGQSKTIADLVSDEYAAVRKRARHAKIVLIRVTPRAIAGSPMASPATTEQRRAVPSALGGSSVRIETLIADEQFELEMHPNDWADTVLYKDAQGFHPVEARDGRYFLLGVPVVGA